MGPVLQLDFISYRDADAGQVNHIPELLFSTNLLLPEIGSYIDRGLFCLTKTHIKALEKDIIISENKLTNVEQRSLH